MKGYTIRSLSMDNIRGVKHVEIEPGETTMIVIRGDNGDGKSSIFDGIKLACLDARRHPAEVIRRGETEGGTRIDLGDLVVSRRWVKDPADPKREVSKVELTAKDGTKLPTPQKVLDKLYDELSFEALDTFLSMKPKERLEMLRKLTGVDTSLLEAAREKIFAARTIVNRDLEQVRARLKAMPKEKPPPVIDVTALLAEQARLNGLERAHETAHRAAQSAAEKAGAARRRFAEAEEALKRAREAVEREQRAWQDALVEEEQAANTFSDAAEAASGATAEIHRLGGQLAEVSAIATANAKWLEREKLAAEETRLAEDTNGKTEAIEKLDADKLAIVAGARMPVAGLAFGDEGVLFNGFPFEQVSQAEQLRVAVGICVMRNARLRVVTLRQGALLDGKSFALLETLCREHGIQCWVELVGREGPASIVIVEGEIVRNALPAGGA